MPNDLEFGFVAVHAGAGYFVKGTRAATLAACKSACVRGYEILSRSENNSALNACVEATIILENDPNTNSGLGSNLTLDEKVECDAGLIDGRRMRFGGVGCLSNVKNPITVSRKLLDLQNEKNPRLIPPSMLAGRGAFEFAEKNQLEIVSDTALITERSLADYRSALKTWSSIDRQRRSRLDTVGVIVVDNRGRTAASCSSGGVLLKTPGRIGHAAHFGCGVFAREKLEIDSSTSTSTAVSCTGCGEYLIRTSLAKTIGERIFESKNDEDINAADTIQSCLRKDFLDSIYLDGMDEKRKIAGAIALKSESISDSQLLIDFAYGHCSSTMCLAFTTPTTKDSKIRGVLSECPPNSKIVAGGGLFRVRMNSEK